MNLCMFYGYLCTGVNVYALVAVYEHIYIFVNGHSIYVLACVYMCVHVCACTVASR